ncbi:hypothetical protein GCM10022600_25480 [Qipengyuania pelagi]|jgi:hypothetical protein|uniref:Uncharacterized protein n=1 Tax=Qipengyuania pelagi TaxID=994320 RepID=A0A844Y3H7_9SPHN|nr:hypothetical protein [Qipengyuania pelagi]MXO52614.1 hypothetical protein [Qipengyuania pelagi]
MRLSTRFNPVGGIQDFWSEFTRPNPYRWPILIASMLCTFGLLFWVTKERVIGPPARPEVTFISTFAEGRTDDEIVASNLANQRLQDQIREEQAVREEEVRDMYRTLGRASGLDVDAMEAEIAADRARQEARRERLLEAAGIPSRTQAEADPETAAE